MRESYRQLGALRRAPDLTLILRWWARRWHTGATVEWEIIHGNNPTRLIPTLQRKMTAILQDIGGISYSPEEKAWAQTLRESLNEDAPPLTAAEAVEPYAVLTNYGSTDVGDVTSAFPTVSVRTAT